MEDWISLREFGRRRKVSKTAVQHAIADKRIPEAAVRRKGDRISAIEYHQAVAAWDANTDPAAVAKNDLGGEQQVAELELAKPAEQAEAPAPKDPNDYQLERAKREKFAALSAELDYNNAIGRVVEVDAMNEAQRRLFRDARDKLLNLADRLTPMITPDMDPARRHATIKRELEKVLNELSDDARAESSEGAAERLAA
jgi:hypothetical protein